MSQDNNGLFRANGAALEELQRFIASLVSEANKGGGESKVEYADEFAYLSLDLSHDDGEYEDAILHLDYGVHGDGALKPVGLFCCYWVSSKNRIGEIVHIMVNGQHASIDDFLDGLPAYQSLQEFAAKE